MRKIRFGQQATYMDCKYVENLSPLACTVLNQWKIFLYNKTNKMYQFSQIYYVYYYVSESSSVHQQEFIHCTLINGICHKGL
jgi:hypothetical protein